MERNLIQMVAEFEYHVVSLDLFLLCARYGLIKCSAYPRMVSRCGGSGALLYVPLGSAKPWYALAILTANP